MLKVVVVNIVPEFNKYHCFKFLDFLTVWKFNFEFLCVSLVNARAFSSRKVRVNIDY